MMDYSLDDVLNDTSGAAPEVTLESKPPGPAPDIAPRPAPAPDYDAVLNDTSGAKGAAEYPAGESPWSDDLSVAAQAAHGLMAQHYSLRSHLADDPDLAKGYAIAAEQSRKAQQDALNSMSIAGQQAQTAPGMLGGGIRGLRYGLETGAIETAPWIAAGAVGGLAGPGGAIAATSAYGAYAFTNQATDAIDRTIQDADDAKLRSVNPDYDTARVYMRSPTPSCGCRTRSLPTKA